jgi:hypothetical protein
MERRRAKRKNVHIDAEITAGRISYAGVVENLAEHGISIETDSKNLLSDSTPFHPGAQFEVRFQTPSGEEITLQCKVAWSFQEAPYGLKRQTGMEIIFPPPGYMDFYNELP